MLNRQKIREQLAGLKENYHLSLTNQSSFEEIYNTKVSKFKFYLTISAVAAFIFVLAFCLISFTSIKTIVPGFESDEMHQELIEMQNKLYFLENEVKGKVKYATQLDSILKEVPATKTNNDSKLEILAVKDSNNNKKELHLSSSLSSYHFYKPVQGHISQQFNLAEAHQGTDIVCNKNEAVKATLSGKIIIALWSIEEGNVIAIQHPNNIVSLYKHNSILLKKTGDYVKAGDVIAIVGNSGELSSGPHLHFEIWQNGNPINPSEIISFD